MNTQALTPAAQLTNEALIAEVAKRFHNDDYTGHELLHFKNMFKDNDEEDVVEWENINTIRTVDKIEWRAGSIPDQHVMEALAEAYTKLSPYQIVERLEAA